MHGVGLVDLDPAHVARVCVLVVRAAEPDGDLRRAGLAAVAAQRDADVVDGSAAVPVLDVELAAPAVAGRRVDGRDLAAAAHFGKGGLHRLAAHRDFKLLIGEGWRDGAVCPGLAVAERVDVPEVVVDVGAVPVPVRAVAVCPGGGVLTTILDPEPVVLEHDVVDVVLKW
eukprot:COSAG04_NODE_4925_length_1822_cov_1.435868_2_plen_170_part_00